MLLSVFFPGLFKGLGMEEKEMKTLLVYSSGKGYVREWCERLTEKGMGRITMAGVKEKDLQKKIGEHDAVVIASSVRAGSVDRRIRKLCASTQEILLVKKLVFALAGLDEKESGKNMAAAFPAALLEKAEAKLWIGGRYIPEQNNFLVNAIMKKITGSGDAVLLEKWETVDAVLEIIGDRK